MEVVLILVVTGVIILAIKIAMTNPKESSNNQSQPKTETPSEEIEFPPSGYFSIRSLPQSLPASLLLEPT